MEWTWVLLLVFGASAVGITVYGHLKAKRLEGQAKSLFQLRNEFLFSAVAAFGIMFVLLETTEVRGIYSDNPTIEDLKVSINELRDALFSLRLAMLAGLSLVLGNVLRAIYAYVESTLPEGDRDKQLPPEDMIKLDLDKQ